MCLMWKSLWYQTLPFVMEYELGGDRAVYHCVCPGRYIEFLYFSVKRQHWYRGVPFAETTCFSVHQKLLQLLNGEIPGKRTVLFSDCGHIRG